MTDQGRVTEEMVATAHFGCLPTSNRSYLFIYIEPKHGTPTRYRVSRGGAEVAQMFDEMKVERSFRHIDWTDYNQEQRELLTAFMRRIDALSNEGQSG